MTSKATLDDGVARSRVSAIVVHRNTPRELDRCLDSLGGASESVERIVVDNASDDALAPSTSSLAGAKVLRNAANLGFAVACNQGASAACGEILLFLNSDAEIDRTCLAALVGVLDEDPGLAAVSPLERSASGSIVSPARRFLHPLGQAAGLSGAPRWRFARAPLATHRSGVIDVPWVRAVALVVRAEVFRALGGFDEGFFFYEEDEDFCWRLMRRGHRVGLVGDAVVRHDGGVSTARAGQWPAIALYEGQLRFVERRAGALGAMAYRAAVSVVALLKTGARRPMTPALPALLRLLWLRSARVSTTGA